RRGESEACVQKWIEARGMKFCGAYGFNQKEIEDEKKNRDFAQLVRNAKLTPVLGVCRAGNRRADRNETRGCTS
ncbi:MAG: hypothetical protein WC406_05195, partial [Methanoregula sp.]